MGDAIDDSAFVAPRSAEPRPGVGALLSRAVVEGEAFIRAEVGLYRVKATRKASAVGVIAAVVIGSVMLVQALVITILIGLMLTIAPAVGTGWALVIVCAGTVVLIAIMIAFVRSRVAKLLKPEVPA